VVAGQSTPLSAADVQGFADLYARHIALEEGELLPMAGRLLGDAELDRLADAMRRRRGLVADASRTP
jgi:hemerythrin-like domain-containing protein